MFLLVSLAILAVDKTGIPEFDSLVYSKGKTITFFDEQGNAVKTKTTTAMYERKIFEFNFIKILNGMLETHPWYLCFLARTNVQNYFILGTHCKIT